MHLYSSPSGNKSCRSMLKIFGEIVMRKLAVNITNCKNSLQSGLHIVQMFCTVWLYSNQFAQLLKINNHNKNFLALKYIATEKLLHKEYSTDYKLIDALGHPKDYWSSFIYHILLGPARLETWILLWLLTHFTWISGTWNHKNRWRLSGSWINPNSRVDPQWSYDILLQLRTGPRDSNLSHHYWLLGRKRASPVPAGGKKEQEEKEEKLVILFPSLLAAVRNACFPFSAPTLR